MLLILIFLPPLDLLFGILALVLILTTTSLTEALEELPSSSSSSSSEEESSSQPLRYDYDFRPNLTSSLLRSFDQLLIDSISTIQNSNSSSNDDTSNTTSSNNNVVHFDTTSRLIFIPKKEEEEEDEEAENYENENDNPSSSLSGRINNSEFQYRLAHVYIFVPLTGGGGRGGADDVMSALLAIHRLHLEMEEEIINDDKTTTTSSSSSLSSSLLGSCNIRLSASVVDTGLSPIQATQQLNQILSSATTSPGGALPVTAVLGGFSSVVTSPLAILTGLEEVVQISHGATAKSLEVKEQYPYLGRTVPSSAGEATAAIEFLQGVSRTTHLAIIFVPDAFGSSLEKEVSQLAQQRGISTQAYTVPASSSYSDSNSGHGDDDTTVLLLQDVMQRVKASDVKHIYAICSEQQLESWLVAAKQANLLGTDYFWFFPGLEMDTLLQQKNNGQKLAPLMHGAAVLQMQGGISRETVFVGQEGENDDDDSSDDDGSNSNKEGTGVLPPSGYTRFLENWIRSRKDNDFMAYVQSKLGDNQRYNFSDRPLGMRPFMFDAMISLGHALCLAEGTTNNNTEFVTGADIFDAFRNKVDIPDGASGVMKIDKETGSRDPTTVNFVLWNAQEVRSKEDDQTTLSMTPYGVYIQNSWRTIEDRSFLFHDGRSVPPDSLGEVTIDFNYLGTATRAVGFTLAALAIVLVFMTWIWTFINRSNPLIRRSNQAFLYTLCAGALFLNISTIFLGMDETTASNQEVLDASCMAAPFFYTSGLSLVIGALITKTLGLYKAYLDPEIMYLDVSTAKLFLYSFAILATNVAICVTWYVVSPLTWNREITSAQDRYGRSIESFGRCHSDQSNIFIITLFAVNACIVVIVIFLSFRARNIETEYGESLCVAVAQAGILQSWLIGVPLLAAVQDDPQGRFLVEAVIIFLTAVGVILLIYVPKISEIRTGKIRRRKSDSNGEDTTKKVDASEAIKTES